MQRLLGVSDLRSAIADGRLTGTTLVWKRGMPSWLPAKDVPELMDDVDDGPDTLTAQRATDLGPKAKPSPSVPAPEIDWSLSKPPPSNMVDISTLRAGQKRPGASTLMGVGDDRAREVGARSEINVPEAPKLPIIDKSSKPDGGWKSGAARQDEEQTVTQLRTEEDLVAEQKKRATKVRKKRSVPPPRKKRLGGAMRGATKTNVLPDGKKVTRQPQQRRKRPVSKPAPKTTALPDDKRPPSVPAPVSSSEVLSEAFAGGEKKKLSPRTLVSPIDATQGQGSARDKADQRSPQSSAAPGVDDATKVKAQASRPARMPTAPLPEVRPPESAGPQGPSFAREPWHRSDGPPPRDPVDADWGGRNDVAAPQPHAARLQRDIVTAVPPPIAQASSMSWQSPVALGAGAAALVLILLSFYAGRVTSTAEMGVTKVVLARTGWVTVPLYARARAPAAPPRPCLMLRAPSRVSGAVSKKIPISLTPFGDKLAVGYGRSITQPRGLWFDPVAGSSDLVHEPGKADEPENLSRVVPIVQGEQVIFAETLAEDRGVRQAVFVPTSKPFVVGFADGQLGKLDKPGGEVNNLWALDEQRSRPDALVIEPSAGGFPIAYRHQQRIFYGGLKSDASVGHAARQIVGSGGKVGRPAVATDGSEVLVVFADRPPAPQAGIELRWAHGPLGKPLADATIVDIPSGGPGGDAMAPAVAALPGNRWLMMWTEGLRNGPKTLRAQTYDRKYRPIGEALRVTPATGSFGQGSIGVVGDAAAALFLMATSRGFEIWGTVLQCR